MANRPDLMKARALMRPRALLYLYRMRLRMHLAQELLAGLGVAVAVALAFTALVADRSLTGSAAQAIHTEVGPANLQLQARSSDGFDDRLLARVQRLVGVRHAVPVLEQNATICRPRGHCVAVNVTGTDVGLAANTMPLSVLQPGEIALTRTTAGQLGIEEPAHNQRVSLNLRGNATSLKVAAILGPEAVGSLSTDFIATLALTSLQRLALLPGRITRILIQTSPNRQAQVGTELARLAQGRLSVVPADNDLRLLGQALRPSDQASEFFALIAILLGGLCATLAVPERRRTIAELRLSGVKRTAVVEMVLFQALCLGIGASLLGLLAGYVLSTERFHQPAGYLAQAFTLGNGTVVAWSSVLPSLIGGILAVSFAALVPLFDLRRERALDAVYFDGSEPGNTLDRPATRNLACAAGGLLTLATALLILLPSLALASCIVLALTVVFAILPIFAGALCVAQTLAQRTERLTALRVAIMSLKATTLRSLALAATGAVALFGSIALGGASGDLLRGIEDYIHSYVSGASVWIVNRSDPTAVEPLPRFLMARIAQLPGISHVGVFQDGYLNVGKRRLWVVSRPPGTSEAILRSQIVAGNVTAAAARIDKGGWIAVSEQLAAEYHAKIGDTLTLPTPRGEIPFRIAATTTNLTWSPGAILMSTADYRRAWRTATPTALGVDLRPGADLQATFRAVRHAMGPANGTEVVSPAVRAARTSAVGREGLSKLSDISTLLLLAAILAIAAALTSAIWQRRASLAGLRLSGTPPRRLRRILLTEAILMLAVACLTGTAAGLYGQVVIDAYLRHVTGFPVAHVATGWRPVGLFALVLAAVLAIVCIPGWLASRVPARLALEGE